MWIIEEVLNPGGYALHPQHAPRDRRVVVQ
jgi:hypothetical protein